MNQRTSLIAVLLLGLFVTASPCFAQGLLSAIQQGDIGAIEKAVEANPGILKEEQTQPPMILALQYGQNAAAKKLLELGADPETKNQQGQCALHWAVMRRDNEFLQLLLDKDVSLDTVDNNEYTPLLMSINYNNAEAAMKLIEAGCRVDVKDRQGSTPLHAAMSHGNKDLVKLLLDKGCDLFAKSKNGMTPFMGACQMGDLDLVKKNFDSDRASEKTTQGQSCLIFATYSNSNELIEFLCEQLDLENVADQYGQSPLGIAVSSNKLDMAKTLLKHQADPNVLAKVDYALYPLISAAANANPEMTKLLLNAGAKASVTENQTGNLPLHVACRAASPPYGGVNPELAKRAGQVIKVLLDADADPNAKNESGQTAFELAVQGSFSEGIDLLIRRTKNIDVDLGQSQFLHWACEKNMVNAVSVLLERDNSGVNSSDEAGQTPLCVASFGGFLPIVKALLDAGAEVNLVAEDGQAPIHAAVASNSSEVMKLLLDRGATLTLLDGSERTPLHVAAWYGNAEAVKVIGGNSINMTPVTQSGSTPLHMAAWQDHVETAEALLDFAVDVDRKDSDGWTALHKAAHRGNIKMIKMLLRRGADKSIEDSIGLVAKDKAGGDQKDAVEKLLK